LLLSRSKTGTVLCDGGPSNSDGTSAVVETPADFVVSGAVHQLPEHCGAGERVAPALSVRLNERKPRRRRGAKCVLMQPARVA
jgi:hypothetical protein